MKIHKVPQKNSDLIVGDNIKMEKLIEIEYCSRHSEQYILSKERIEKLINKYQLKLEYYSKIEQFIKIYKTQEELDKDLDENGNLIFDDYILDDNREIIVNGYVKIEFDNCVIKGNIKVGYLNAKNIEANNIETRNGVKADRIKANFIGTSTLVSKNIKVGNIDVFDIKSGNIEADYIYARDSIKADDIISKKICTLRLRAKNIVCCDIYSDSISYYEFCIAYKKIECYSIKGRQENSIHKCLDGEIEFIKD